MALASHSMARLASLAALLWLCAVLPRLPGRAAAAGGALPPPPAKTKDGCPPTCGGVDIPFPFGFGGADCARPGFQIVCNDTVNGVRKPFLHGVELLNVSLPDGQARVLIHISSNCFDAASGQMKPSEWQWNVSGSPFTFSDADNKFTVVGCRTLAYIGDSQNDDAATYKTGCVTFCAPDNNRSIAVINGSCSGMGCCQTAIPPDLQLYKVWFDNRLNSSGVWGASRRRCSYAVLMDSSNFSTSQVTSPEFNDGGGALAPIVLDWIVGKETCEAARTKPGYACVSSNSMCIPTPRGRGYVCNCTQGFEGNPYLADGCRDIDECTDHSKYPCFGICNNRNGSFSCSCPAGTEGNASIQGHGGCQKDPFAPGVQITVGIVAGLLVVLIGFLVTEVFLHKRRNKRQGFFEQHGGQMLSRILKREGNISFTFYDREEIVKATRSFRKANIVGEGAHGAVYSATLHVGDTMTTVAVKRCKHIDKSRTEEFVQELVILCHVNHPNIVRLLGCCLHFEAPMLVYEFARNGTLNDLLHGTPRRRVMLATRLRIATETAEALAHLHAPPHTTLHGDVKPENILLGDGWVAKVSDFGCSTLDDNIQVVPKGTLAYLDPEFMQDFQITKRSDVYSFGVVLMELLTGKKPLVKEQKNLTVMFQECLRSVTIDNLLDDDIVQEGTSALEVIHQAAELASRCTALPSQARPAMVQVAEELRQLSNMMPEQSEALQALEVEGHGYSCTATGRNTTGFYRLAGSKAALSTAELAR